MERKAIVERNTNETKIRVEINLDGTGKRTINTGVRFFDHMLDGFARHGLFDLKVSCQGDTDIDCHHTIEDVGIVLGDAIRQAVGDKKGIARYGHELLPMDEALVLCAVDLSGRSFLIYEASFAHAKCGDMDTQMAKEFFYAVSSSARMSIHIRQISGQNDHHIMEAMFKSFARALRFASETDPRVQGIPSTKGVL